MTVRCTEETIMRLSNQKIPGLTSTWKRMLGRRETSAVKENLTGCDTARALSTTTGIGGMRAAGDVPSTEDEAASPLDFAIEAGRSTGWIDFGPAPGVAIEIM